MAKTKTKKRLDLEAGRLLDLVADERGITGMPLVRRLNVLINETTCDCDPAGVAESIGVLLNRIAGKLAEECGCSPAIFEGIGDTLMLLAERARDRTQ